MNIQKKPQPASDAPAVELDGISRRFCDAVASWTFDDIPADVIHTVKLFVLDTFGVIGGAAGAPGIREVNARLSQWERDGSATSLVTGTRMSPPHAALANGAAAHALDFDDMHDPARIHSFCVILPAMLAAAEDIGDVDGRTFLLALTVAAEAHARLGYTCYNSLGKGWHPTMTLGVLAASLGIGRMLGLEGEKLLDAFGLASHQACGSAQSMLDGVLSKRLGAGLAARGAVTAAFLAADGITGPFRPLEGNAGLFKLQERGEVRPEELFVGMGEIWQTRDYSIKPFPCCRCNHTTIDLAFGLRAKGIRADDISDVQIFLPQVNFQTVGQPYDVTRDSVVHAQFNAAYSFARALTDGKVDLLTYTKPGISDPAIAALASRVTVSPDPEEPPTAMGPSRIEVTLRDGTRIDVRDNLVPGSPEKPMSEEAILDKFRGCMLFGLGLEAEDVNPFIMKVLELETVADVRDLTAVFPRAKGR
jgi:2-methylcitrate dehydratase PrpD